MTPTLTAIVERAIRLVGLHCDVLYLVASPV